MLLDIGVATLNGIQVSSEIRKSNPNARTIFIAQNNDYLAETVLYSFAGGADGLYPARV